MTKPVRKAAYQCVFVFMLVLCVIHFATAQEPAYKATVKKIAKGQDDKHKGEKELTEILVQLELIYNVTFAYQKKFLSGKFAVYKPLIDTDLESYLREILTPEQLAFKKIKNAGADIYVISPLEEVKQIVPSSDFGSDNTLTEPYGTKDVYGCVKDGANGVPIAGANVVVKGTTLGTITDSDGKFTLEIPAANRSRLIFSYIGFMKKELEIDNDEPVQVMLDENTLALAEVVVTALGIAREQKALGYSVGAVNADQLVVSGNTNFASALYGKIPGVRIRTAPGGATSAVTVQIRGFNSLNYSTQPLYIVDGVPIRDGNEKGVAGINNAGYYDDQRLRGNGILDISPDDIENLTVLKGASATALYGSDASNGAVVITTKKGVQRSGLGVDVNYDFSVEKVAFAPNYQNVYGPGYDRETNLALGASADGWVPVDTNNDGVADNTRPLFRAYGQFGPKMEGQEVLWWDGSTRTYSAQPDNYKNFYRTGFNSQFNVALHNQVGKVGYRLSYTRNEYEGIQVGGKLNRNFVNLNTTFRFNSRLKADWMVNYTHSHVYNRPYKINRLTDSYNGFFSRAEKMSLFFDKYQTSEGYKWVPYDQSERNPEEALKYTTPRGYEVMNLLWRQLRDQEEETQNRLISSFTLNYDITHNLQIRGRVGNDITRLAIETKQHNEYPTEFNGTSSTGSYGTSSGDYDMLYADAILSYNKTFNPDFTLGLNAGFQVRDEQYHDESLSTSGGLKVANVFSLDNSYNPELTKTNSDISVLKYAYLAIANFGYKNIFFVEATGRQEYSSTLPPSHNGYFYPSVNTGFVFSDAFELPRFINYGKLRASYGVVGNAPPVYEANILYNTSTLPTLNGSVTSGSSNGNLYGNDGIRPERKYEGELGLEVRMANNRLGADFTYYSNRIKDQILKLDLPSSTGASKVLTNVGELQGHGIEIGLNGNVLTGPLKWNASLNAAFADTKVHELMPGVDQLIFREMEGSSIRVVAEKNESIGNIYVHPRKTDAQGNHIISSEGLYVFDKTKYVNVGNLLPKATGGFLNFWNFKSFSLTMMMDYSFGGKVISNSMKYATGSGMYESTLPYRDAEHGGLTYYVAGNGDKILLDNPDASAPDGSTVYHDGVLLEGVTEEGLANTKVIEAAAYYLNTFSWGNDAWNEVGSIYDNSYIKLREAALTYNFPKSIVNRLHFQRMQISIVGRNLFYAWRTLENLDPESTIGTTWLSQGIDEGSNAANRSYGFKLNLSF